jgi:DMSO/TMAO reductase YedYZ molybdopterin-dependent catalytic subunit
VKRSAEARRGLAAAMRALLLGVTLGGLPLAAVSAVAADPPTLEVFGTAGQHVTLGASDLRKLTVRDVDVTDPHSKQRARYRGVPVSAVLSLVGAPGGDALRGKALASHVRVDAADGYRVSFSLAELDAGVGATDAIVAFERDGQPLGSEIGPFRIVVPTDKRGARWARQVVSIRVLPE